MNQLFGLQHRSRTDPMIAISPDTSNISRYFLQTLQIKGFAEKYKNCQNLLFQALESMVF